MRQEHVLDLAGLIYEAALEPARGPVVLRRIADLGEGVDTGVYFFGRTTSHMIHDLSSGFPGRDGSMRTTSAWIRETPTAFGSRQGGYVHRLRLHQ